MIYEADPDLPSTPKQKILHAACFLFLYILCLIVPVLIVVAVFKNTPQCRYGKVDLTVCQTMTIPKAEVSTVPAPIIAALN